MNAKRTTTVVHGHERWKVPYGFGRVYRDILEVYLDRAQHDGETFACESISDALSMIGYEAAADVVLAWPLRKRIEAWAYAENVHLRASDNSIRRHPRPAWMLEPWCGGRDDADEGIWANPRGTVLT